jgi:hypothetical protein
MQYTEDVRAFDIHQHCRRCWRHGVEDFWGQWLEETQRGIRCGDDRTLEHVFQLPYVSRPVVSGKGVEQRRRNRVDALVMLFCKPLHQMVGEYGDVTVPLAQGRHDDREDTQAVIQVSPKSTGFHFFQQVPIRRGDHSHIDLDRARRSETFEFAVFQHPEQFRLRLRGQLPNFVEKDRAAVRQFESSYLRRSRVRESPSLTAEQLTFHQGGWQGGAVDSHEPFVAARAAAVDHSGGQPLTSARLAEEQYGGI